MIESLLILTCLIALTQQEQTKYALLLFAVLCSSYSYLSEYITNDYLYYILAAYIDLIIIKLLSKLTEPSEAVVLLQKLCLYFIYINIMGFIVYYTEINPNIYAFSSNVLYMTVLMIAIFKDRDYGQFRVYSRLSSFFSHNHTSFIVLRSHTSQKKVERVK